MPVAALSDVRLESAPIIHLATHWFFFPSGFMLLTFVSGATNSSALSFFCLRCHEAQCACWTQHHISGQLPDCVWTQAPHTNIYITRESLIFVFNILSNILNQLCLELSGTS